MDFTEVLNQLIRLTFVLLGVITLADYLRRPDQTRLDIALMFASLAVTFILVEVADFAAPALDWLRPFASAALVAQPYLLIRLVAHFRQLPRWVELATLAGMLVSVVAVFALPSPLPTLPVLLIIAYFGIAEIYAAVVFVRGALNASGVSRRRMFFAATGSLLLAGPIILAGVIRLLPGPAGTVSLIQLFMVLLSAVAYYFGFAAPRWLRHTWQLSELHQFLRHSMGRPADERSTQLLAYLCDAAVRTVGGTAAVVAVWDEQLQKLAVKISNHPELQSEVLEPAGGAIGGAWALQTPKIARRLREMSPSGQLLARPLGADANYVVPIQLAGKPWGLLVVSLQRSTLFWHEDVDLLVLFCEQTALALEQAQLLEEQTQLVQQLRGQTLRLEAANKELEAFSYSVSHDLRAPLRHIEGFTDLLLRQDSAGPQQRQHLQRISEAAIRMGRLIDDLLSFSRMGRAELRLVPVRLDLVVADAWRDLQSETEARNIVWKAGHLPVVTGDPEMLRLAFVNLLSNALKYTRGRDPAEIEVGSEAARPNEVQIFVRDNGVGFDMKYAGKLFGVFQRLHHADEFEGVGIGLANVRRIVQRHGGRTWAAGEIGRGAAFYMALPTRSGAEAAPESPTGASVWPVGVGRTADGG